MFLCKPRAKLLVEFSLLVAQFCCSPPALNRPVSPSSTSSSPPSSSSSPSSSSYGSQGTHSTGNTLIRARHRKRETRWRKPTWKKLLPKPTLKMSPPKFGCLPSLSSLSTWSPWVKRASKLCTYMGKLTEIQSWKTFQGFILPYLPWLTPKPIIPLGRWGQR